jgi:hypothetical protein
MYWRRYIVEICLGPTSFGGIQTFKNSNIYRNKF